MKMTLPNFHFLHFGFLDTCFAFDSGFLGFVETFSCIFVGFSFGFVELLSCICVCYSFGFVDIFSCTCLWFSFGFEIFSYIFLWFSFGFVEIFSCICLWFSFGFVEMFFCICWWIFQICRDILLHLSVVEAPSPPLPLVSSQTNTGASSHSFRIILVFSILLILLN